MEEFDYIIVGGGSAGATLAARLSGKTQASICLLEAGRRDRHPFLHIPAGFIKVIFSPDYTWSYETEPGPHINGRKLPAIQGRVLGGGGSINGMVWVRGQAQDYDGWAAAGNSGWSYQDMLPHFKRLETRIGPGDDEARGRDGAMPIVDLTWQNKLVDTFIASAQKHGIPYNADYNGRMQEGVARYQFNIGRGRRASAAKAFLRPAEKRSNLNVVTDALVTRILFEGKRAVGVTCRRDGEDGIRTMRARREIILCCGALNTPKLLQLSGVGPAALLAEHGIQIVHGNDSVGENLMDHYTPRLTYRARDEVETINNLVRGPRLWKQIALWAAGRPSIIGMGVVLGAAFCKSRPGLDRPDMVVTFTPGTFKAGFLGRLDDVPGLTCGVWQLRPDARGHVRINSPRIEDKPSIQPNFLGHEGDRRTVVDALKIARNIMATPELAAMLVGETMPGIDKTSDAELLDYARAQGLCGYHYSGTARMGPAGSAGAVVDPQLRVHGLEGLRIADASIMPVIVSGNTHAATIAIASKAADLIAG